MFRKNNERFIMLLSSLFIGFLTFILFTTEIPKLFSGTNQHMKNESCQLLLFCSIFYILYSLLMRKMIIQYKTKHWNFDKTNWQNGWKGKKKVIAGWFDRGE